MNRLQARYILPLLAALTNTVLLPAGAAAVVDLHSEFTYENGSTTITDKTNDEVTESDRSRFDQLYNLDIIKKFFPNLTLRTGGIFELDSQTLETDGETSERDERTLHPLIDLNLSTTLYSAGIGFEKTEIKRTGTNLQMTRDTRDEYYGRLLWEPVDLPRLNLNFTHTDRYNDVDRDVDEDEIAASSRYDWKEIFVNYAYVWNDSEDLLNDIHVRNENHDFQISHSHNFTDYGVTTNGSYRINSTETEQFASTSFLSRLSQSQVQGIYSLTDDIPEDEILETGSGFFLVDGVKSGSSVIQIGLAGDETRNVSIGLDYGLPRTVEALRVFVDRDALDVAQAFGWDVYISDDNRNWTEIPLTRPVSYDSFDRYFEITFDPQQTRYIKVVTTPLSPAADPAATFRELYVTELESFVTSVGDEKRTSLDQNVNLGVRWNVNNRTSLGYTFFHRAQETEPPFQRNRTLSNGLNLRHDLSEVFRFLSSVTRQDTSRSDRETLSYTYTGGLQAQWLDTLKQTLTYSGTNTTDDIDRDDGGTEQESNTTNNLLLRTIADLYRGWSANLDMGYSWNTPREGGTQTTKLFRFETDIQPHEKLTTSAGYAYTQTEETGRESRDDQRADIQLSFVPTNTISLFARLTHVNQSDDSRTFQNYNINWSPFPGGTLQFDISYNESLSTEGSDTKGMRAGLSWKVNKSLSLRSYYERTQTETETILTESDQINVVLRISL